MSQRARSPVATNWSGFQILSQGLIKGSMMVALAGRAADMRVTGTSPVFVASLPESQQQPQPGGPPDFSGFNQMMSGDTMPPGAHTGADFQLVELTVTGDNVRPTWANSDRKAAS